MAGPLEGVRIVDMTNVVMGPFATRILGDMGADVIKVESPKGDSTRRLGPSRHAGMGSYFMNLNRSKRSIVLDLKRPDDMAVMHKLIGTADVYISNVRPKALGRLGLSYADLARTNERLVYVSLVGYGQDGPYAARPAYDDLMQGATGIAMLAAEAGGGPPRYAPLNMADRTVGLYAVNAVMGALYAREKTGKGQAIEVPMFESMTDFVLVEHLGGVSFVPPAGPPGYSRTLDKARRPYKTLDGYISTQVYTDKHWRDFFEMSGQGGKYDTDPRFADLGARTHHVGEVYAILGEILAIRSSAQWLELLNRADIPATALNDVDSLVRDPHHVATGFFEEREHPSEGRIRAMKIPSTWSGTPPQLGHEAPRLGEHTAEIMGELGYAEGEIKSFFTQSIINSKVTPS